MAISSHIHFAFSLSRTMRFSVYIETYRLRQVFIFQFIMVWARYVVLLNVLSLWIVTFHYRTLGESESVTLCALRIMSGITV